MLFIAILAWLGFANAAGESFYGESCETDSDCWSYLACKESECAMPGEGEPPSEASCSQTGYQFSIPSSVEGEDLNVLFQCPPDCRFDDHSLYGPRCMKTPEGCAEGPDCKDEGRCGYWKGEQ